MAFGLSLCIECIQGALHVGIFEGTDLVLNTVGAGMGVMGNLLLGAGEHNCDRASSWLASKSQNNKYCLSYNITSEICFEYNPVYMKWILVRGEQCRCK